MNQDLTLYLYTEMERSYAALRAIEIEAGNDPKKQDGYFAAEQKTNKFLAECFEQMDVNELTKEQLLFILGLANRYRFMQPFRILMKFRLP